MKIPKKINIFGKVHKVQITELHSNGIPVRGLFNPNNYHIYLAENQDDTEMFHTFLHECFHAVVNRVSINQSGLPPELEEVIVDSFSTFLVENFSFKLLNKS